MRHPALSCIILTRSDFSLTAATTMPDENTPRQLKLRTSPLSVSFSRPERDLVVQAAEQLGDTVSAFIRDAALRAASQTMNDTARAKAA